MTASETVTMRTIKHRSLAVLAGLVLLGATPALADIAGTYEVKFEEVSTNCTTQRLPYKPQPLVIKVKGRSVTVDIDRTPVMVGVKQKNGKVSAKSKPGSTMLDGMRGVFSVAGRITPEGMLHLVMVGEYSANGKALCSQSWNVTGPKAIDKPRAKKKSAIDHETYSLAEHLASLARLGA